MPYFILIADGVWAWDLNNIKNLVKSWR